MSTITSYFEKGYGYYILLFTPDYEVLYAKQICHKLSYLKLHFVG